VIVPLPDRSTLIVAGDVNVLPVTVPVRRPCPLPVSVAERPLTLSVTVIVVLGEALIAPALSKKIDEVPLSVNAWLPPVIAQAGIVAGANVNALYAPVYPVPEIVTAWLCGPTWYQNVGLAEGDGLGDSDAAATTVATNPTLVLGCAKFPTFPNPQLVCGGEKMMHEKPRCTYGVESVGLAKCWLWRTNCARLPFALTVYAIENVS
jgi:hypothetical protein